MSRTIEELEQEEARLQALIDKRQEKINSIREEEAAIRESMAARKEALIEELAASDEIKNQMYERNALMGDIATMQERFNELTAFEKDLLRDKNNALARIEMANRDLVNVMQEIENSAEGSAAIARQQEGSLSNQQVQQERLREEIKKQKREQEELKKIQEDIAKGLDIMGNTMSAMFGEKGPNGHLGGVVTSLTLMAYIKKKFKIFG